MAPEFLTSLTVRSSVLPRVVKIQWANLTATRLNRTLNVFVVGVILFLLASTCSAGQASAVPPRSAALHLRADTNDFPLQPGLFAIHTYQKFISPLLGPRCNFHPSCSRYAAEAIQKYGIVKGSIMATDRLTRCHYCAGLYYRRSNGLLEDPVADHLIATQIK